MESVGILGMLKNAFSSHFQSMPVVASQPKLEKSPRDFETDQNLTTGYAIPWMSDEERLLIQSLLFRCSGGGGLLLAAGAGAAAGPAERGKGGL